MSMLARLSLANRSLIALATIGIILVGALLIPSLKQELYPSLAYPAISIIASYPGASPTLVEQNVTNPLEQNIQGLQGIQTLTSTSSESTALITAEYDFGSDLNKAKQDITDRVNKAQTSLPSTATVQVQSFNISDQPIMQMAVTSSTDQQSLAVALKQEVVPVLEGLPDVANVSVTGVRNQIVTVTVDTRKLEEKGLNINQIQSTLQSNNKTLPAGEITNNGQTLSIRVGNTFGSLQDLKDLVVGTQTNQSSIGTLSQNTSTLSLTGEIPAAGQASQYASSAQSTQIQSSPVKLGDVATIEETLAPSTTLTRTNGQPSLGLAITKTSAGNTVSLSQAIHAQIPTLEKKLGHDAQITVISDQAPSIQSSISGLEREGLVGAFFAIIVILFFLFSLRSTLVAAISIPLSLIIALIGLWIGNYSLNLFTLGGLTIAVGRVIDDSIVVLENIYRHLRRGEQKRQAVITAVSEVAGAITASTLTTVAVFLPIAFTGGIAGQLFKPFSITVTVALLASLGVALTIVPVLAYWFLRTPKQIKAHSEEEERPNRLEQFYIPLLRWVTTHRTLTLVSATFLFAASLLLTPLLSTNLFDSSQQNTFSISQQLPPATALTTTEQAASRVEAILKTVPEIQMYQVTIGSSNSFLRSSGSSNTASFSVTTREGADQASVQQMLRERLKTLIDVGTITISTASSGFNNSSTSVVVQAADEQTLKNAAQMVYDAVRQIPNTNDVTSSAIDAVPLVDIRVDPNKALKYNLTASQVGMLLSEVYSGTTVTTVTLNNIQQDVKIQLGVPVNTVEGMKDLLLPIGNTAVKLGNLADVVQINGPIQITHTGGARTATISATISGSNVGKVNGQIKIALAALHLPEGASYSMAGVSANQSQTFQDLELAIGVAILLVYLVMVATFRSLIQPLILMVSIPFAATGSILLLFLTHTSLGAPALIGLLMLVGIVVTNAIILLDLIRQYRKKGLAASEAVLEGGRRRLRPILMTAIATILALLPMALGLDKSSGFIAGPLAIVVIGGLTSSTILTLLLVPTLYLSIEHWWSDNNQPEPDLAQPSQIAQSNLVSFLH